MSVVELLRPDCVVNHILCQKRSHYIGLFEVLGIPVIGVDSQVCANITDKGTSRAVLVQGGVNVPPGQVLVRADIQDDYRRAAVRPCYTEGYPAVVKPTRMENSVGVEVVRSEEELGAALERAFSYGDSVLVDQFIAGREVRCGAVELVPGQVTPLEVLEYCVDPDGIRKFEDKLEEENGQLRQAASTKTWLMDARQEEALRRRVQAVATRVHAVMGCTDFSQIDCRISSTGEVYVLEVNSFCSFGPLSLIPKLARNLGLSPALLYSTMVDNAVRRKRLLECGRDGGEVVAVGA